MKERYINQGARKHIMEADLTVSTSKRETFSTICAESLSCGTPIVGFKVGALETVAPSDYSEFVEFGDTDGLEMSVRKWLYQKICSEEDIIKAAKRIYSNEKMIEKKNIIKYIKFVR